jgi:hypothetical protein
MQKEKRSQIDDNRLSELRKDRSIYIITCGINGCPCEGKDEVCGRGFFSLFIQALYGIDFAIRLGVRYHVDFGNIGYRYSDTGSPDKNFWNYYFIQPTINVQIEQDRVVNRFIELYPIKIWARRHFREINSVIVHHLKFTGELKVVLEERATRFREKNILGVHIRGTDHSDEISPVSFQRYEAAINKFLHAYDSLFVATDCQVTLTKLRQTFGDKVIFNRATRSNDGQPVHLNETIKDKKELGFDVFTDCYCLSLCKKVILNHSNVSYSVLLLNPEITYVLLENLKPRIKRLKTLSLYYLNHWGIRKW